MDEGRKRKKKGMKEGWNSGLGEARRDQSGSGAKGRGGVALSGGGSGRSTSQCLMKGTCECRSEKSRMQPNACTCTC
eukprot:3767514-Pleurochrysis_carterae.AAC.3